MWMVLGSLFLAMSPLKDDAAKALESAPLFAVGDARIAGGRIKPGRATYYVRVKNPAGSWVGQGTITETAKSIEVEGQAAICREQVRLQPDWKRVIHTAVFANKDLTPFSTRRRMDDTSQYPVGAEIAFDLNYKGKLLAGSHQAKGGEKGPVEAIDMGMAMFEGDVLGLLLAALPLREGFLAKLPVMYSQQRAPYWVVARVVGRKTFTTGTGTSVNAWAVETDWHDMKTGDVYPGKGSGGTYYVVPDPPAGYPNVPKYINDSFDSEVIPQLLAQPGELRGGS